MAYIMSVASPYGNSGKTTLTIELGIYLAARGNRTLLLDCTTRGMLSWFWGLGHPGCPISNCNLGDVHPHPFSRTLPAPARFIRGNPVRNLYILADPFSAEMAESTSEEKSAAIAQRLQQYSGDYEFILCDTSTSSDQFCEPFVRGSDSYLTVLLPLPQSECEASIFDDRLDSARDEWAPRSLGTVVNLVDDRSVSDLMHAESLQVCGDLDVFKSILPHDPQIKEALALRRSLMEMLPESRTADRFHDLFCEIVKRVDRDRALHRQFMSRHDKSQSNLIKDSSSRQAPLGERSA